MLLLASTSDKVQIVTTTTADIDVHASYVDLDSGTVTPGRKNTKINTAATTDVVLSPAGTAIRNLKTLQIANVHASASNVVTIQHTDGTNVVQIESVTLLAGERIAYREGIGTRLIDATGVEKTSSPINIGQYDIARLSAAYTNSSAGPTASKVTGLDKALSAGTYLFEYHLLYQTAATTTALKVGCNFTGTVTRFSYDTWYTTSDSTATAGNADQDMLVQAGGIVTAQAARAKTTTAPMFIGVGVDTANSDMLAHIMGIAVVTVAGNLELYGNTEVASSQVSILADSLLRITRVA